MCVRGVDDVFESGFLFDAYKRGECDVPFRHIFIAVGG